MRYNHDPGALIGWAIHGQIGLLHEEICRSSRRNKRSFLTESMSHGNA
jgi:hypothetical protein